MRTEIPISQSEAVTPLFSVTPSLLITGERLRATWGESHVVRRTLTIQTLEPGALLHNGRQPKKKGLSSGAKLNRCELYAGLGGRPMLE